MNYKTLFDAVLGGARFEVEFGPAVSTLETYLEPGMRGRIVGARVVHGDVAEIRVDVTPFEAHNQNFESANYFDIEKQPTLTAREAGDYPKDGIVVLYGEPPYSEHFNEGRAFDEFVRVLDPRTLSLLEEFQASGGSSYLEWLEARVLESRGHGERELEGLCAAVVARIGQGDISISMDGESGTIIYEARWTRNYACCAVTSDERVVGGSTLLGVLMGVLSWEESADRQDEGQACCAGEPPA